MAKIKAYGGHKGVELAFDVTYQGDDDGALIQRAPEVRRYFFVLRSDDTVLQACANVSPTAYDRSRSGYSVAGKIKKDGRPTLEKFQSIVAKRCAKRGGVMVTK